MATTAEESDLRRKTRHLIDDLRPFKGRLYLSLSIGAICAISTVISMMYHFPEAAIGCYLVIFLMKKNAAENVMTGIGIIVAVSLVVFLLIGIINLTIDHPPAQIGAIIVASFIFLYMDSATKAGEQAGIVALVISFVLTLLSDIPLGEIATRAVLYAWAMVFVPMATMALYNLLFGLAPQKLLRWTIVERLELSAAHLETMSADIREKLIDALGEGTAEQEKQLQLIKLFKILYGKAYDFLERGQSHSYRLMLAVSDLSTESDPQARDQLAEACRTLAAAVENKKPLPEFDSLTFSAATADLKTVGICLDKFSHEEPLEQGAPVNDPFLAPDAFQNPIHLQFALKTTLAAVTCFFIYTSIDWQGIHTAMITCYVAALGTTGDTVHKLVLRITGCLIGAFFGLIAILFVIPQLESVGGLALLIFAVVALSAWVSTGNERISYGGVQIALAFLLTVLQGFQPGTSLSDASDRIMGILLGNAVVYIIFTNIWPVSVSYEVSRRTRAAVSKLKTLAGMAYAERSASTSLVASVQTDLGIIRNAVEMASYEPRYMRPSHIQRKQYRHDAEKLNGLSLALYLRDDVDKQTIRALEASEPGLVSVAGASDQPASDTEQKTGDDL
ncbi:FUSC family protein [Martelella mediterranea]|uniref:Multidrug resistance protein MdtO n=1 Tax=Martelella mediterranea TaxID=293089 RepID=A0A4R3NHT5_9HYPH|nr:FUSC family protein [Martelella mediterranea]TCT33027.1 multidrug resistance protein MdtO [Martelella mediterranea]